MPAIATLLREYRDRTGATYEVMSQKVRGELLPARIHQLTTAAPKEFPKSTRTVELLAELLEVPVATIVLAFAAGLGLDVRPSSGLLSQALPPGADELPGEDRDTVVAVARALLRARADARPPIAAPEPAAQYDYTLAARRGPSEGRALRREQDDEAERQ